MNAIIDEVLYLYSLGYQLKDILQSIKNNKNIESENVNTKINCKKERDIKVEEQYIDLGVEKSPYPESYTKLAIEEHQAVQFNQVLRKRIDLTPGLIYKIFTTKRKKIVICFIGEFKGQTSTHIRLQHRHGYSETFLKSDLISGEYLIKEA